MDSKKYQQHLGHQRIHASNPEDLPSSALLASALGIVASFSALETKLAEQGSDTLTTVTTMSSVYRQLCYGFTALGVDISLLPDPVKPPTQGELISRPQHLFVIRRHISRHVTYVNAACLGVGVEDIKHMRDQKTWRLELTYSLLAIWSNLGRLAKRLRISPTQIYSTETQEAHHGS